MKKHTLLAAATLMFATTAAIGQTPATPITQDGYSLTLEYTVPGISGGTQGDHRSGVGINDKFFVNYHYNGVKVYDKNGTLITTISPTTGYHNWVSCNVDAAGHLLVQLDTKATFDGNCSTGNNHGFMVIDTKTNAVVAPFISTGLQKTARFDSMSPVDQDIMNDYNTRIFGVIHKGDSTYQMSYNGPKAGDTYPKGAFWKVAEFDTKSYMEGKIHKDDGTITETVQASTAYAMQYTTLSGEKELAVYANPLVGTMCSGEGKYGNGIRRYAKSGAWSEIGRFFYTPMHSGLTGFNIFSVAGRQFIIYPAGTENSADAFAISEVRMVQTALTDMNMTGETLVNGLPQGSLKALVQPARTSTGSVAYAGSNICTPSYTIEEVPGDPLSVYIYMFNSGAPSAKYKFTVPDTSNRKYMPEATVYDEYFTFEHQWQSTANLKYDQLNFRTGVGTNGKFYAVNHVYNTIHVFTPDGHDRILELPEEHAKLYLWPCMSVDDAGNVILRYNEDNDFGLEKDDNNQDTGLTSITSKGKHGFLVITAGTEKIVKIPCGHEDNDLFKDENNNEVDYRSDAMGRIEGNILGEDAYMHVTAQGKWSPRVIILHFQNGQIVDREMYPAYIHEAFNNAIFDNVAANKMVTTAMAQTFTRDNKGNPTKHAAVLANNYLNATCSEAGYGNNILCYNYTDIMQVDAESGLASRYQSSGDYYITPEHVSLAGFAVFSIRGQEFVMYPIGRMGLWHRKADAFAIARAEFTKHPSKGWKDRLAANGRRYGAPDDIYPMVIKVDGGETTNAAGDAVQSFDADSRCASSYNIEPYVDKDGKVSTDKVTIYAFNAGAPMNVYTMSIPDVNDPVWTGLDDIDAAAEEDAPVEYYTLQGIRVANPGNGIYIRRQGSSVTKVLL